MRILDLRLKECDERVVLPWQSLLSNPYMRLATCLANFSREPAKMLDERWSGG